MNRNSLSITQVFSATALALLVLSVPVLRADVPTAGRPIRLAVLTGEGDRAVSDAALAQLEVALTEDKDVTLLERAEIRKILAEQKLSAAGLTDPAMAVKLGKLLSVEMFLFLDRIPKSNPAACRVQIVETATGISLASGIVEEAKLVAWEKPEADLIRRGIEKQKRPPERRHYIGLLGVKNEEAGHMLDGLAEALSMFLATDMEGLPDVVVLDREHLQWLSQEGNLTGIALQLRTSSLLISGGVRRVPGKELLDVTLTLQPLAGGAGRTLTPRVSDRNMAEARQALRAAIAEALGDGATVSAATTPAIVEASQFLQQANILFLNGYFEDAIRAAEAAYALAPTRRSRMTVVRICSRAALQPYYYAAATEEAKRRSLGRDIRRLSLLEEQYRVELEIDKPVKEPPRKQWTQEQVDEWNELSLRGAPGLGIVTTDGAGEVYSLLQERATLQRRLFDLAMSAAAQTPEKYGNVYWEALDSALESLGLSEPGHAKEKAAGLREVTRLWREAPGRRTEAFRTFGEFFLGQTNNNFQWLQNHPAADTLKERELYCAVYSEMTADPDNLVRLVAHFGLVTLDPTNSASAEAVLKIFRDEINWKLYTLGREKGMCFFAWRAASFLGERDPKLAFSYCQQLMGPWMEEDGSVWMLCMWSQLLDWWLDALEKGKDYREADEVARKALTALSQFAARSPTWQPSDVNRAVTGLQKRCARYAEALHLPVSTPGWEEYVLQPLSLGSDGSIEDMAVEDDRVYCLRRFDIPNREGYRLKLTEYQLPAGGAPVATWQADTKGMSGSCRQFFCGLARVGARWYAGTAAGLVEFSGGASPGRVLTEADGLPGGVISAVAACGGKLYLGLGQDTGGKTGLASYDPATNTMRLIDSTTVMRKDSVWYGGHPDPLLAMLPDEERRCVWLGLFWGGLWCYYPQEDKFVQMCSWRFCFDIHHAQPMAWSEGRVLCSEVTVGLLLFDPESRTKEWLASGFRLDSGPNECKGPPVFGAPGDGVWPAVRDGDRLLTGGAQLNLHRKGQPAAPCFALANIIHLTPTRFGVLAIARDGKAWLIRRK